MIDAPDIAGPINKKSSGDILLPISEMSKKFDVTLRTLRFYEEKKLLKPLRRGARRFYSERDMDRMRIIVQAKKIGLTLVEIRKVFTIVEGRKPRLQQLRELRDICAGQEELLREQQVAVAGQIEEMYRVVSSLDQLIIASN